MTLKKITLLGGTRILTVLIFVSLLAGTAWACPMCKEVAVNQSDLSTAEHLRGGFAVSLGLLLSTPYVLFGGIALGIARSVRKKKNNAA